jgi:hypothetical protein
MLLRLCRKPARLRMLSVLALQLVSGMPSAAGTIEQARSGDRHRGPIGHHLKAADDLSDRLGLQKDTTDA